MSSIAVDNARQEWEESQRRLEAAAHDRFRYERLLDQVEAVTDELRRRVGQTFTLAELVDVYADAESWTRDAIEENAPHPGWARTVSLVEDAAFHLYARGARDYEP